MEDDENIDNDFTKRTTDFYKSGAKRYKIVTFSPLHLCHYTSFCLSTSTSQVAKPKEGKINIEYMEIVH